MATRSAACLIAATLVVSLGSASIAGAWQPSGPAQPRAVAPQGKPALAAPAPKEMQPPPQPGDPAASAMSVAVLPFRVLKADANSAAISESMQQTIITTLNGAPTVKLYHLAPPTGTKFDTVESAIAGAKVAGVAVVVYGTYQATDAEARVSAGIYQSNGKLLGVANARGNPRDLFAMQDEIARQVREVLAPGWKTNPSAPIAPGQAILPPAPLAKPAAPAAAAVVPNGVAPAIPRSASDEFANVSPVPFEGSSLQRALNGEAVYDPAAANNDPNGLNRDPNVPVGGYGVAGGRYWGGAGSVGYPGPINNTEPETGGTAAGTGHRGGDSGSPNSMGQPSLSPSQPKKRPTNSGGSGGSATPPQNSSGPSGGATGTPPGTIPGQVISPPVRRPRG